MASNFLHSPAQIAAAALIEKAVGVAPDLAKTPWQVHFDGWPDGSTAHDDVIAVLDQIGQEDGSTMHGGELFQHQGLQFAVRASDKRLGWRKADELQTTLAKQEPDGIYYRRITIESKQYLIHCFSGISGIIKTREPSTGRWLFSINCTVSMRALN